jgi:tRNA U34 5-methylaminomethyl-2-thiouridine-forming methyltransferase MnmC
VSDMYDEERIAELLRLLPPAPGGWVAAAAELPTARRALADLEARVLEGAEERAAVTADLEAALRDAGYDPSPTLVEAVRRGLER